MQPRMDAELAKATQEMEAQMQTDIQNEFDRQRRQKGALVCCSLLATQADNGANYFALPIVSVFVAMLG